MPSAGVGLAVAGDGVAAVVVALGGAEQRHQVQVGEPQLPEVVDVVGDLRDRARVPVDVADAAEHPLGPEPFGVRRPLGVEGLEVAGALVPRAQGERDELGEGLQTVRALAVDEQEEAVQLGEVLGVAGGERVVEGADAGLGPLAGELLVCAGLSGEVCHGSILMQDAA